MANKADYREVPVSTARRQRPVWNSTPVSAFVVNYNEDEAMKYALESLQFCDEVMLVDKSSQDDSVAKAQGLVDRIMRVPWSPIVEQTRQYACQQCRHDWVLFLDSDECVTPGLAEWIIGMLNENADSHDAVSITRMNYRFGCFSTKQHDWPNQVIRMIRRSRVQLSNIVHAQPVVDAKYVLRCPSEERKALLHLSYPSFEDYLTKANRYTELTPRVPKDTSDPFSLFATMKNRIEHFESMAISKADTPFAATTYALRAFYDINLQFKDWIASLGDDAREADKKYRRLREENTRVMMELYHQLAKKMNSTTDAH